MIFHPGWPMRATEKRARAAAAASGRSTGYQTYGSGGGHKGPESRAQCPKRFFSPNMPCSSKKVSASETEPKMRVEVSVMKGEGFFFGFQTT